VKKLSNDGGDLLYVEGAERSNPSRMSGRSCGFSLLMAGFRWRMGQHLHLSRALRQNVVPWAKRKYPDGKYVF
jgi:hypothetical protein